MNEKTTSTSGLSAAAEPAVLNDPLRNRGVAFTLAEREALGLTGRLPSAVLTLDQQAQRAYQQLQAQGNDLAKNVRTSARATRGGSWLSTGTGTGSSTTTCRAPGRWSWPGCSTR